MRTSAVDLEEVWPSNVSDDDGFDLPSPSNGGFSEKVSQESEGEDKADADRFADSAVSAATSRSNSLSLYVASFEIQAHDLQHVSDCRTSIALRARRTRTLLIR